MPMENHIAFEMYLSQQSLFQNTVSIFRDSARSTAFNLAMLLLPKSFICIQGIDMKPEKHKKAWITRKDINIYEDKSTYIFSWYIVTAWASWIKRPADINVIINKVACVSFWHQY